MQVIKTFHALSCITKRDIPAEFAYTATLSLPPHPSLYFYFFLSLLFVSFCLLICGFFFPFSILYSLNFSFSPVCVLPLFFTLNLSVYFFRMQLFIILYHSYRFVHFVCSIHRTDLAHSGDRPHAQRRRQLMTKYSCQIK